MSYFSYIQYQPSLNASVKFEASILLFVTRRMLTSDRHAEMQNGRRTNGRTYIDLWFDFFQVYYNV